MQGARLGRSRWSPPCTIEVFSTASVSATDKRWELDRFFRNVARDHGAFIGALEVLYVLADEIAVLTCARLVDRGRDCFDVDWVAVDDGVVREVEDT